MISYTVLRMTLFSLFFFLLVVLPVTAQECSATDLCATGCCSEHGFCGTTEEHCGEGCLSTCDFKLGCDASNPCADGTCCSKFGFCGFGEDFCSPENCVAGCNAKSQCDPGTYGADYVQLKKCPLNVCCSKWGYCGATTEFCGDKEVKRPSCDVDSSQSMKRVVGYYEGWAARRTCQAFLPEDVPLGVYTHLNFAFASIDPESYKITPAQAEDVALYSRLTALKKSDSALKVFIAIGGWTFNDEGPTFRTFSELAADESKQQVFFASLISFMSTYNFDGVDIDWEYPTDKDRGGKEDDYANFPQFMKNLKAALDAGSGGRNGISITLPVSFWYLQNFDIVELEKWVDFFNVMSYDLHGSWDKGNKWVGALLNSHTNMTEISEYLDLLWRNEISPEKVTLGLAFYSRTFLAADSACTQAGCMFDAVGEAGPCSNDDIGGTLTNAELTDQIRQAGVIPTLDEDAMVKVAVIGRKWITYDDEDTFKLKTDAARKLCLGGVMVWAVSQDYSTKKTAQVAAAVERKRATSSGLFDSLYSAQLQSATLYKSLKAMVDKLGSIDFDQPSPNIIRNQCYWANCGIGCGNGYKSVPRLDRDSHKNEVMQDGSYCQGGTLRKFCCPDSKTIPRCGWFDFFNGKCGKKGGCPAGSEEIVAPAAQQREVGSTQVACNNGKAQVACCQTQTESGNALDSMMGYNICKWFGVTNDKCDAVGAVQAGGARSEACRLGDSVRPWYLIESFFGSGATYCRNPKYKNQDMYRPLCCQTPDKDRQWTHCREVFTRGKDGKFCEAQCPEGTIRLAMDKPQQQCKGGANAICCEPRFLTEANNADEVHQGYVLALENVFKNPGKCDWDSIDKGKSLGKRQSINYKVDCKIARTAILTMLYSPDRGNQQRTSNDVDLAANRANMPYISGSGIQSLAEGYQEDVSTAASAAIQTEIAEGFLNSAKDLNDQKKTPPKQEWMCPIWDANLDIREDIDDGGKEVIDSDLQGVHVQFRRRDYLDPDVPISTIQEEGEDVDDGVPFDDPFDSDSTSYPGRVNWLQGLENLRHFHLKDSNEGDDGEDTTHITKDTKLNRLVYESQRCEQSFSCRARMLGFDLSKDKDRLVYFNFTQVEAKERPRRFEDILELRKQLINGTLDKRQSYQMGQSREYTVRSSRHLWPGEIIHSSPYPNGNQGDDLIFLNQDNSRYVTESYGCGPSDYRFLTNAAKNQANGIWVSEHILELNSIGRFMTASLDGGLGGIGVFNTPSYVYPYFFNDGSASIHEVLMFADNFHDWDSHTAISPADTCLALLGSMQNLTGLVVCDSSLNTMKTRIYKLMNPVGEIRWNNWCVFPSVASLQYALSSIQTVMAVFDYYDDPNVKDRHQLVYEDVMDEMIRFEVSYMVQFGDLLSETISGQWQRRWHEFMTAQFLRVEIHTRMWLRIRLNELFDIWSTALHGCWVGGYPMCQYCMAAILLINSHLTAIETGQKIQFDRSIFEAP